MIIGFAGGLGELETSGYDFAGDGDGLGTLRVPCASPANGEVRSTGLFFPALQQRFLTGYMQFGIPIVIGNAGGVDGSVIPHVFLPRLQCPYGVLDRWLRWLWWLGYM